MVKGTTTYYHLAKCLEKEFNCLGFTDFPSKRAFNDFLSKSLTREQKTELRSVAERILSTATKNGKILDIKLVEEAIKKKVDNSKDLREAVKLVKRLVYPCIDLKIQKNAVFTTRDMLDVLVYISQNHDFCNNGSQTFRDVCPDRRIPHGDTVMYHLHKIEDIDEIKSVFERIFDIIFKFAKKECGILHKRKHDIAIDIHKIPYFGSKSDSYVIGGKPERGTSNFYEFLTCSIVVAGKRFIIDAIPIHPLDIIDNLVDRILKRAKEKIRIERAYLDRGFDKPKVINVLKSNKIKFIMPKIKSDTVKAWFDKAEGCDARVIEGFQIGQGDNKAIVNLVLVDDEEGIKRAFITNMHISEPFAHRLFTLYSRRWGIETSYRNVDHDFKPRTTSKDFNIRLFYFLFSVCLYNLWVLVNICIGINLYGKVPEKPIITAKRFSIVLYRVQIDYG